MATSPIAPQVKPKRRRRKNGKFQRVMEFLRERLVGGLLIAAPFVITYLIFKWIYDTAAGVFQPLVRWILGHDLQILSFAILVFVILVMGFLAVNFVGRGIMYGIEAGLIRVPLVGATYSVVKQLITTLGPGTGVGFSRVVEIEYPRKGMWSIGFLTGRTKRADGVEYGMVYIPTSPTPQSGWLAIVPMDEIFDLQMTANQALSMTISAGITAPNTMSRDIDHPASASPDVDPGILPPAQLEKKIQWHLFRKRNSKRETAGKEKAEEATNGGRKSARPAASASANGKATPQSGKSSAQPNVENR